MTKHVFHFLLLCLALTLASSCGEDSEVNVECPPKVDIRNLSGRLLCLPGETLAFEADLQKNPLETELAWLLDGQQVATGTAYTFTSTTPGTFELSLQATNRDGTDTDVANIIVQELKAPHIQGFKGVSKCLQDESITLTAVLEASPVQPAYRWTVDGVETSTGPTCTFSRKTTGAYEVVLTATNTSGQDTYSQTVEVVAPFHVRNLTHWTGQGSNQSVLAVQWMHNPDSGFLLPDHVAFLAWGYRWDAGQQPTGADMLKAIAGNPGSRLYVILMEHEEYGTNVRGLGYDGNADGKIELKNATLTLTEKDFVNGVYTLTDDQADLDGLKPAAAEDLWMGGWKQAYTSYYLAKGDKVPATFEYAQLSPSLRHLESLSWDVWTLSSINDTQNNTKPYPAFLQAAGN